MITLTTDRPLTEAVAQLKDRKVFGSAMTSAQWELLPASIRDRVLFSARVEDERLLQEIKDRVLARLELEKRDGRTVDRAVFIDEVRAELKRTGYRRPEDVRKGSLRDLKSERRLGLIWDMNVAQAQGYARWMAGMTPEALANEPAWELVRVRARREVRPWPVIWANAGGRFYGQPGKEYPNAPGRMIAAKTDPIWTRINRFGHPWPPFDFQSGMGWRGIDADEAEDLGVAPAAPASPADAPGFNAGTRMDATGIPEARREAMRSDLGDMIRFEGDEVLLVRDENIETLAQRKLEILESLRQRAREHYVTAWNQRPAATAQAPNVNNSNFMDGVLLIEIQAKDGNVIERTQVWARMRLSATPDNSPTTRKFDITFEQRESGNNTYVLVA